MGIDSVIFFRTDGNTEIATGHMMRCLSVARACFKVAAGRKIFVFFLVSDKESQEMICSLLKPEEKISVQILENASYRDLERELPALTALFESFSRKNTSQPVLFLDSYFVTPKYLETLAPYACIAYLDDLQLFDYPVDLIINYDVLSQETQKVYEQKYSLAKRRLLGAAYTPLREEFSSVSAPSTIALHPQNAYNVLITSGGSDPYHTCLHLLDFFADSYQELLAICAVKKLSFQVVVGKLNQDKEALRLLTAKLPFISLHENVTDMASLMSSCNLAFSAAGTTLYELCALGIPTASFILADNQITCAKAFEKTDTIPLLGDVRVDEEKVFSAARVFLESMLCDPHDKSFQLRKKTAARMQQLVDGQGSERIAKMLLQ